MNEAPTAPQPAPTEDKLRDAYEMIGVIATVQKRHSAQLERVEDNLGLLAERQLVHTTQLTQIIRTQKETNVRMGAFEALLRGQVTRLNDLEGRMTGVEGRLTGVEGRLDEHGAMLEEHGAKLDQIAQTQVEILDLLRPRRPSEN